MDIQEIRQALQEHPNLAEVARATGVGHNHLHRIKRGELTDLRLSTARKIQRYFQQEVSP